MPAFLPKVRAASSCSASCRSLRASASAGFSGGGGAVASAGVPGKLLAGKPLEVELIENGKNITVSNSNKRDYVEKLCFFKLYSEIQRQVDNFLEGFYELIPKDLVSIFNYKELELLISGLPNFDCKS